MSHDDSSISPGSSQATLAVSGMDCASCVAHVEKAARSVAGVSAARVNLARGRAVVEFDPGRTDVGAVAAAIMQSGYPARAEAFDSSAANAEQRRIDEQAEHARSWLRRALVAIALWLPVELLHWILKLAGSHAQHGAGVGGITWLSLVAGTISIVYVGAAFYRSAWKALARGTSNMDTLIAMGASVAYVYSLVALLGYLAGAWHHLPELYFMESAGLLALISLGHWLEARARDRAGSAIGELLNLAPATALKFKDEGGRMKDEIETPVHPSSVILHPYEEVPVAQLQIGDRILIRPGDRIAVDGRVVEGRSGVDESMITGESLPVLRQAGENVLGGTLNTDGRLVVRVTKVGSETALAQIVRLVDQAQSSKPPVQQLADRVAAVFVPAVLGVALLTAIGWFVVGTMNHWDSARLWGALARSVCSVLIIACPCALGLAVPAALMVGTGNGARRGILIRSIDALQHAERIDTVVLDKTGTITRGQPVVSEVVSLNGEPADELLAKAAAAEMFSEHPLAKAIVRHARERGIAIPQPTAFTNEPGLGIVATIDGGELLVGNTELLSRHGAKPPDGATATAATAQTLVHIAAKSDGSVVLIGVIRLADEIKPDSAAALRELHDLGLRTVLLTGDNAAAAKAIAQQAGIDDVRADVRPEGKVQVIRELQARHSQVAMVGDGINDAPALAAAELGIAVGSGADVAKEAGDIVLVGHSLHGVAAAIRLSRATMRVIRQNLFFAFVYNVIAIPLAALGLLNPLIAAAAMALSDVTVIGNALRLRRAR